MRYFIRTEGCQMNVADSQRIAAALEQLGYRRAANCEEAEVIVLNTCVVRQSAEDKAWSWLGEIRALKKRRPEVIINLMGCLVGIRGEESLRAKLPEVDVFSPPSDPGPLLRFLAQRPSPGVSDAAQTCGEVLPLSPRWLLPASEEGPQVSVCVPVIYGCSHACSFCIIPYRRGKERSRPLTEIVTEVQSLVEQGVKEVILLGQIVDRYGVDLGPENTLPRLLQTLHTIEGLARIRFLTSHPNYLNDELLETVAALPKVCEHIEVPLQAGDDEVLQRMRRGYTSTDYVRLIKHVRHLLPHAAIATDIIVGFPGESEAQFQRTYDLLAELRLDVAHLACYSPRPQTLAARTWPDDVPAAEKKRRLHLLEELQTNVAAEINARLLGQTVEVLVEERHKGKWRGRTRTNKLVFFTAEADWHGHLVPVTITHTSPWSLQGELASPQQ